LEEHRDNSTVSPALSGIFVLHTTHSNKPFHNTGFNPQTSVVPATAATPALRSPLLCSKLLPTSKWQQLQRGLSNPTKPTDKYQSLSKPYTNTKPFSSLWPQHNGTKQEKSIPYTMESLLQSELTKKRHFKQDIQKTRSRRLVQRRKQRLIKKELDKRHHTNTGLGRINQAKQYCLQNFGFCSNPDNSITKNFKTALQTVPPHTWLQPSDLTFHNLCKQQKLPLGT
jgi:hypothetical protein